VCLVVQVLVLGHYVCRVEPSHRKEDFQWQVAPSRLDDSNSVQMMVNPLVDHLEVLGADEIDLVEHYQVGKTDLVYVGKIFRTRGRVC
jgi:hypothetical protein